MANRDTLRSSQRSATFPSTTVPHCLCLHGFNAGTSRTETTEGLLAGDIARLLLLLTLQFAASQARATLPRHHLTTSQMTQHAQNDNRCHVVRAMTPPAPSPPPTAARLRSVTDGASPKPRVLVNDCELLARARRAARELDFSAALDSAAQRWKPHRALDNGCTMFTSSTFGPSIDRSGTRCHWVLSTGQLRASVEEIARVLSSSSDGDLNAVMHKMYPKDYIHGSVVRVMPIATPTGTCDSARLAIKTSTFVRSSMWSANEQWCYLELVVSHGNSPSTKRFTVTLASMAASELTVGKTPAHRRVHELRGLLAGYLIEPSTTAKHVRVVFLGRTGSDSSADRSDIDDASQRNRDQLAWIEHERLLRVAEGVSRVQELVLRRRLGAQVLADRRSFQAVNTRCICCTRRLLPMPRNPFARLLPSRRQHHRQPSAREPTHAGMQWLSAKRCHLCGHNVCDKCWLLHAVETRVGRVSRLRVCSRCLEFVESGDYANVGPSSLGAPQVQRDPHVNPTGSPVDGAKGGVDACRDAGQELALLLLERLRDASSDKQRRRAVLTVIRHLVNDIPSRNAVLTDDSDERAHVAALRAYGVRLVPSVPLHECQLADTRSGRSYPIRMPALTVMTPEGPMPPPAREERRLATIERGELGRVDTEGAEAKEEGELDVLCALAAREMQCSTSVLTVVGKRYITVLGANQPRLRRRVVSRDQSFCQHAIMNDSPLLVPHPEADVRFQNIDARTHGDFRFYCGFPLRVALGGGVGGAEKDEAERTTVGVLCCMDRQSRELTQAQYSTMAKLATAAARVVERKSREASGKTSRARTTRKVS